MFETTIQVKPPSEWRPGMTWEGLQREIQKKIQTPGMADVIWMPIQTRTEMLTTGFRSNLGLRVYGRTIHDIADAGQQIEQALKDFPDTRSVFAERSEGGRYLDITPDRDAIARYGLRVDDINQVVETASAEKPSATRWKDGNGIQSVFGYCVIFATMSRPSDRYPWLFRGEPKCLFPIWRRSSFPADLPKFEAKNGQLVTYVSVDTTAGDFGGYVKKGWGTPEPDGPPSPRRLLGMGRLL